MPGGLQAAVEGVTSELAENRRAISRLRWQEKRAGDRCMALLKDAFALDLISDCEVRAARDLFTQRGLSVPGSLKNTCKTDSNRHRQRSC